MIFAGTSSNGWSDIFRGFFLFDTSSIPDADDVSAAELDLFVYTDGLNDNATLDQKINVSDSNPSSNTSLSTADYDTITNITTGATQYATEVDLGSISQNAYFTLTFNATGMAAISKTGISKFSTLMSSDLADSEPTWGSGIYSQVGIQWAETTGTTQDPKLIVTHASSPTPTAGTGIQNFFYTYDAVGNITRITDAANASTSKIIVFGYDDIYRLAWASTTVASTSPDYYQSWGYTAVGNMATSSTQGVYSYSGVGFVNPHAATTIGTSTITTLAYDPNGNLASTTRSGTVWDYTWNYRNQLTQVATGTATTTFGYDHNGNRVSMRSTGSASTTYPSRFYNVQGATTTKHIYANGELIATIVGNGSATSSYIVHTDHLGGTHVLTNASGTVVQTADYYPFGDSRLNNGSISEQRGFTGAESHSDLGLNYMRARYQSGLRGTFISQDPLFLAIDGKSPLLADPQQQNSYSYARNNPLRFSDPTGKASKDSAVAGIFGAFKAETAEQAAALQGIYAAFAQSASNGTIAVGGLAEKAYQNSGVARFALNHPYLPAIVGSLPLAGYGLYIGGAALLGGGGASMTTAPVIGAPLCEKFCDDIYQAGQTLPGKYGTVIKDVPTQLNGIYNEHAFNRLVSSGLHWDDVVNIINSPTTLRSVQNGGNTILNFTRNNVVITDSSGFLRTVISPPFKSTIQSIISNLP